MRYFRTSDAAAYEQARLSLDAVWGHVPPVTCIDPAVVAPRDTGGRIVLAVDDEFCQIQAASLMIQQMLGSGVADEIAEAEYMAAVERSIATLDQSFREAATL
jgi:hypothetical protein